MYSKIFTSLFLLSAGLFGFSSYGLYTFLRIWMFIFSLGSAYFYYQIESKFYSYIFIILAILFNPIIKISFNKNNWQVIDIIVGIFLLALAFKDYKAATTTN